MDKIYTVAAAVAGIALGFTGHSRPEGPKATYRLLRPKAKRKAGPKQPGGPRICSPRPPLRSPHHPDVAFSKIKTPEYNLSRVFVPIRNGARPVASALGIRSVATPRGPIPT